MAEDRVELAPATPADLDRVERLLSANDLPTADVRDDAVRMYVARVDGEPVGAGGLEVHGADGLLRSVVVAESHRGRGYGAAICEHLEARARRAGVGTLYLLTTTAVEFFRARGYGPIDRAAVPEAVRATRQFSELCPATATCMRRER
jgi:amino-acid N-acetyltransferase